MCLKEVQLYYKIHPIVIFNVEKCFYSFYLFFMNMFQLVPNDAMSTAPWNLYYKSFKAVIVAMSY